MLDQQARDGDITWKDKLSGGCSAYLSLVGPNGLYWRYGAQMVVYLIIGLRSRMAAYRQNAYLMNCIPFAEHAVAKLTWLEEQLMNALKPFAAKENVAVADYFARLQKLHADGKLTEKPPPGRWGWFVPPWKSVDTQIYSDDILDEIVTDLAEIQSLKELTEELF